MDCNYGDESGFATNSRSGSDIETMCANCTGNVLELTPYEVDRLSTP